MVALLANPIKEGGIGFLGTPGFIPVKFYSLNESLRVLFVSYDTIMDFDGFGATYKLLNHSPPSK